MQIRGQPQAINHLTATCLILRQGFLLAWRIKILKISMNLLFLASTYVAPEFLPQVNDVDEYNSRLTRLNVEIKDYIVEW